MQCRSTLMHIHCMHYFSTALNRYSTPIPCHANHDMQCIAVPLLQNKSLRRCATLSLCLSPLCGAVPSPRPALPCHAMPLLRSENTFVALRTAFLCFCRTVQRFAAHAFSPPARASLCPATPRAASPLRFCTFIHCAAKQCLRPSLPSYAIAMMSLALPCLCSSAQRLFDVHATHRNAKPS